MLCHVLANALFSLVHTCLGMICLTLVACLHHTYCLEKCIISDKDLILLISFL